VVLGTACGGGSTAGEGPGGGGPTGGETGDESGDTGEAEPAPPRIADKGCHEEEGRPGGAEPTLGEDGYWQVVEIPSSLFDTLHAVVFWPADGTTAYSDGAPVVVTAPPSLDINTSWASAPKPTIPAKYGVIEVAPVYPAWNAAGSVTSGDEDDAGPATANALTEAIRFATDQAATAEGEHLAGVVGLTVCDAKVAVLGASNGGITAVQSLAARTDLADVVAGFGTYESPSLAQLAVADAGAIWMDPDTDVDGDGNGVTWDDGRIPTWETGLCDANDCDLAYGDLAWDATATEEDVFPGRFAHPQTGILYADNNGNGALDLGEGGGLDADGSGALDADEDFVFLPHLAGDGVRYYSPTATVRAVDALASWPDGVATQAQSEVFWATRHMVGEAAKMAEDWPTDTVIEVVFTHMDHGQALADRPHSVLLHDLYADAGFYTRYNVRGAALDCLVPDHGAWPGGPPAMTRLLEGETEEWAFPAGIPDETARAAAGLSVLWDVLGEFDGDAACGV
jgi:hypothetical protein